jgi:hypothetical protein
MQNEKALNAVIRAIESANDHLGGRRDNSLSSNLDSQIRRFAATLREMKALLESDNPKDKLDKYMARAIADSWPFDSNLGKLICKAEQLFHSNL